MLKAYTRMLARINSIQSNEEGATAVEYGLIVALIAGVMIVGVALFGTNLADMFNDLAACIQGAPGAAACTFN